jgi:hypothetical protein
MEEYLNTPVAVLPARLLEDLGVHWVPAQIGVTVLALLGAVAGGIIAIGKFLRWVRTRLRLRDEAEKGRVRRRQLFAEFVESRVRDLNRREEWSDYRFAELEAEVETVAEARRRFHLDDLLGRRQGLRREKSLSKALMKSDERLILLRGDPGSGKSVALRFVARRMALKAMESNSASSVIPLYVNLKDFRRGDRPVDGRAIEDFVLESLRRRGEREVDRFLNDEFSPGKAVGGWFFLFDSFDEIPEVLSSTEDDKVVQAYSQAIADFVQGMHSCRGVIASRHFRSPQEQGLPTFRIVPLSERRKLDLLAKADLRDLEPELVVSLQSLTPELAALSGNPLFLGLLVEYAKDKGGLPEGWHDVFESFVDRRLQTDRERVRKLFDVSAETLRERSEEIAFTMTHSGGFGLSPAKGALAQAYQEAGFTGRSELDKVFKALAWIKLGRIDDEVPRPEDETFTFAHRRFQEYFATCVVLREPDRVDPRSLLTDARWRETAVTLFHAQPAHMAELLVEAETILVAAGEGRIENGDYRWPPGVLHLLSLLQSAFAGRATVLPASLRERVGSLLALAAEQGTLTDRKWVLEVAGTMPEEQMAMLLLSAFRGQSNWLREVAFRQVARLGKSPPPISAEIRRALIEKVGNGDLRREWPAIKAQVMRLQPSEPFVRTANLLRLTPVIDLAVFAAAFMVAAMTLHPDSGRLLAWAVLFSFGHLSLYPLADMIAAGGGPMARRIAGSRSPYTTLGSMLVRSALCLIPLGVALLPDPIYWRAMTFGSLSFESIDREGNLVPAILWLYASSWAISSLVISRRSSPGIFAWPFLPLSVLGYCARALKGMGLKNILTYLGIGAVFLFLMIVLGAFLGLILGALPDQLGEIFAICLVVVWPILLLSLLTLTAFARWRDWRRRRRWFSADRTSMTAEELLRCLSSLQRTDSAGKALREVRLRQLLEKTPEGVEIVRDLLAAMDGPGPGSDGGWRSTTFSAWLHEEEGRLVRIRRFRAEVPDELGRLLEDLERENEVPVA